VTFGDFNGDGKIDIALANAGSDTMNVLLGQGDGTFGAPLTTLLPSPALGFRQDIAAADFDGDGRLDVAVVLAAAGNGVSEVAVFSGRGDGPFQSVQVTQGYLTSLVAVDMNGDKSPDLVGYGYGSVSVCLSNGDGTFQPCVAISNPVTQFLIADFNRDGMPDVATLTANGITAYLNLSQPPPALTVVSAANFTAGPLAPNSIASAFGEGILPAGQTASGSLPLPTTLAGVTVTVQDSTGASRLAPLYFASDDQINFVVPAATAPGSATLTVSGAVLGRPLTTQIQVVAVAPALFTEGPGIAAAYVVQVPPGSAQTIAPVFVAQSGSIVATPIDLIQPGQVFLILFGTGFDAATAASTVATVQGVSAQVTYCGPQPIYPGLDQVNLLLPQPLAGTGVATVSISIGEQTSNSVFVTIQ
jgi:uncharacterized protein (TIGR03437 family)